MKYSLTCRHLIAVYACELYSANCPRHVAGQRKVEPAGKLFEKVAKDLGLYRMEEKVH